MAYGQANALSFFQSFMNDVLQKYVIVYLEDILKHSRNLTKHISHVRLVLHCLLTHGLYAKEFHKTELSFIGYHIGRWGVGREKGIC